MKALIRYIPSHPWIIAPLALLVYALFSVAITSYPMATTPFAYYTLLVDAFLQARTNIIPAGSVTDLSFFQEKWYLYWGPSPTLFIFPFILLGGVFASDVFYTLIAASCTVALFALVVKEFSRFVNYSLPHSVSWIAVGHFAFASPVFSLAFTGKIWHTSQVIAMFYLLLFLWLFFLFLNTRKIAPLVLSLIFFHLAFLARMPLGIYGILLLYPLTLKSFPLKKTVLTLIVTSFVVSIAFLAWYNASRFGSPFENGVHYQLPAPRYEQATREGRFLDSANIPHNAYYYFFSMPFTLRPPFLFFDPEGTSIFVMYPLLILFLISLFIRKPPNAHTILLFMYASCGIILSFLMLFFGTGWVQFGNRYILDIIPLLFLGSLFVLSKLPVFTNYLILFYGIYINLIGALVFYSQKF